MPFRCDCSSLHVHVKRQEKLTVQLAMLKNLIFILRADTDRLTSIKKKMHLIAPIVMELIS